MEYPDAGRSSVAGPLRESVSVRAGLEKAGFLFLGAKAFFLGGFVENLGNGIVPPVAIPSTGTNGGMITEAVEDWTTQGALCVLVEKWDAEGVARPYV